ncbi:MAG: PTS sugar transporter subunit IIA [Tissierellia bacterium]|nr:PTS sugar transporter subunit IIA [Tissierellia bacterium]
MNEISELIYQELIDLENDSKNKDEFFEQIATKLEELNFVEESFNKAIKEREAVFPTGLEFSKIKIALPHTDTIHIKKPFIFINKLNNNIEFIHMGTDDQKVDVDYIFVLGIKDPKEQVGLLAKLMDLFSNDNFVYKLENAKDKKSILKLF